MRVPCAWSLVLLASNPAMSAFISASSSRFFPRFVFYTMFAFLFLFLLVYCFCIDLLNLFLNYFNFSLYCILIFLFNCVYIYIVYYCILIVFCIIDLRVFHGLININQSINQSIKSSYV